MNINAYDREAQREIERWQEGDDSWLSQVLNLATAPIDWLAERATTPDLLDQFDQSVEGFLSMLNGASHWTYRSDGILEKARAQFLELENIEQLRGLPLTDCDELARGQFSENALLACIEGGGTGLGGIALIAADIPLLLTINLRLIQQVGESYGFVVRGVEYRPLVLAVFNAASSGQASARHQALREITVAASGLAHDHAYKGHVSGTFGAQNRHLPREIAKNLVGRKLAQTIPIAGAAIGAGVNYWFTMQTAETAYMLFRSLHIECRERK